MKKLNHFLNSVIFYHKININPIPCILIQKQLQLEYNFISGFDSRKELRSTNHYYPIAKHYKVYFPHYHFLFQFGINKTNQ